MPLRKLPAAFGLSARVMVPAFFNTRANLDYVGQILDISLYGVYEMSTSERHEFMVWYDKEKDRVFDNRRVLEDYCQDDVTVLREACTIFRREFIEIGNIEVFLEAFTIASACNKVLRKKFLKPYTIGLIPAGGYTCNQNYTKKALIWLLHIEQEDGCRISHARNGREYRLRNYRSTVWTVIVTRQGQCTSSWVVIFTVVPVALSGISVHRVVTLYQRGTNAQ